MSQIFSEIKRHSKRVAIFGSLFLIFFLVSFYVVNMNLSPRTGETVVEKAPSLVVDQSVELKKRMGSTTFSVEGYGDWAKRFGLTAGNDGLDGDVDKDELPNYLEYVHGTDPTKADTDNDGFSDKKEIANGYDPDAPGDTKPVVFIKVAKLGVDAPMVWSKSDDEKAMLSELENGVTHYLKTAAPGQNGNAVISGHSSNYLWAKGNYNYVFRDLNNLQNGDVVTVKTIQQNGRVLVYSYIINDKFVTTADDDRIFADSTEPTLTLSTCWPIGTNLKRVIVKAQLAK